MPVYAHASMHTLLHYPYTSQNNVEVNHHTETQHSTSSRTNLANIYAHSSTRCKNNSRFKQADLKNQARTRNNRTTESRTAGGRIKDRWNHRKSRWLTRSGSRQNRRFLELLRVATCPRVIQHWHAEVHEDGDDIDDCPLLDIVHAEALSFRMWLHHSPSARVQNMTNWFAPEHRHGLAARNRV